MGPHDKGTQGQEQGRSDFVLGVEAPGDEASGLRPRQASQNGCQERSGAKGANETVRVAMHPTTKQCLPVRRRQLKSGQAEKAFSAATCRCLGCT